MSGYVTAGDPLACAEARIRAAIARSEVPEDPVHADNTLHWLRRLAPDADPALRLAALAHDIERATPDRYRREQFADYDAFKAAHAARGARLLRGILDDCGVDPAVAAEACRLVRLHEVGGDPRADLLREADSLSYFEVNLPLYLAREGRAETLRRCRWGVARLTPRGRALLRGLRHGDPALDGLLAEALRSPDGEDSAPEGDAPGTDRR